MSVQRSPQAARQVVKPRFEKPKRRRQENWFMRNATKHVIAAGLLAFGWVSLPAAATTLDEAKSQGFVRGANANEKPYAFMDADGNAKGIGPEVAAAVWQSLGVKDITWSVTPFGTLIPGLKARRYDFVGAEMNILPDRCKQVAFTEPN